MKKGIAILFFITFPSIIYSQSLPSCPINIQSPNAAGLGKYGDVPMNLFTGTPSITIPLLSLDKRNSKMDISLSYDATGVRVQGHPSWVGQNWALNAGGVITRSVQGYEDEYPFGMENSGRLNVQKCGHFNWTDGLKWVNTSQGYTLQANPSVNSAYLTPDGQPDIFIFNFMGISGKFFLGNDRNWKVQCDRNIDVDFDILDGRNYSYPCFGSTIIDTGIKTIYGFIIRDEEGNSYSFGYDYTAIEYSIDFFYQNYVESDPNAAYTHSKWKANAWYLTKVTDKYGNILFSLEYLRGKLIADFYEHYRNDVYFYSNCLGNISNELAEYAKRNGQWGGCLISPVYLSRIFTEQGVGNAIEFKSSDSFERPYAHANVSNYLGDPIPDGTFPLGTVEDERYKRLGPAGLYPYLQYPNYDFQQYLATGYNRAAQPILGLRWRKLESINFYNSWGVYGQGNDIQKIRFQYNNGVENENERLMLTKVEFIPKHLSGLYPCQDISCEQPVVDNSYSFFYNNLVNNWIMDLPEYTSQEIDHWGYYNGYSCSLTTPQYRNANEAFAKLGVLTKIVYPTGGFTDFNYESNRYTQAVFEDRRLMEYYESEMLAGGLRIVSINNYDGRNTTKYSYSYGIPVIYNGCSVVPLGILTDIPKYTYQSNYFRSNSYTSLVPLSNCFGTQIEYPNVLETCEKNGTKVRYTTYKFSSSLDIKDENAINDNLGNVSSYLIYSNNGFRRGKLKEKTIYDGTLHKKEINSYGYRADKYQDWGDDKATYGSNICSISAVPSFIYEFDSNNILTTNTRTASFTLGATYKIFDGCSDLVNESKTIFTDDGKEITTKKRYDRREKTLNIPQDIDATRHRDITIRYLQSESTFLPDNITMTKKYVYPWDVSGSLMGTLTNKFRIQPIANENYYDNSATLTSEEFYIDEHNSINYNPSEINGVCIGKEKWTFRSENNLIVPSAWLKSDRELQFQETNPDYSFEKYNSEGNILCFKKKDGIQMAIVWDNIVNKPLLTVENMSYDDLFNTIHQSGLNAFEYHDKYTITSVVASLRLLDKKYKVSNYFYTPTNNIDYFTMPNSKGFKYTYDDMDRLSKTKTYNDKLLEELEYNFRPTP